MIPFACVMNSLNGASSTLLALILLSTSAAATDDPFIGRWKMNPRMSRLGGVKIFRQTHNSFIEYEEEGDVYSFKPDGQPYTGWLGESVEWKHPQEDTWESKRSRNGIQLSIEVIQVQGKNLVWREQGTKPDGQHFEDRYVYKRISSGKGLIGKWECVRSELSSPAVIEIAISGEGGITLVQSDRKSKCEARFDGKDYPVVGPTMPRGITHAFSRRGKQQISVTEKENGKTYSVDLLTVSRDGEHITEKGRATKNGHSFLIVYDRLP